MKIFVYHMMVEPSVYSHLH